MSGEDRDPDIDRVERTGTLDQKTDSKWHRDLRDDRNEQRALCVTRTL